MLSPDFGWIDLDVLAIRADCLALLVPLQRLAHVEGVTSVIVVVGNLSIDRVTAT